VSTLHSTPHLPARYQRMFRAVRGRNRTLHRDAIGR